MRARFLAIVILLFLIGLPVGLYWFFFQKNTSYVSFFVGKGVEARIFVQGKFSYSWLPIADKILSYQIVCHTECQLGPIVPTKYYFSVEAENFSDYSDEFLLQNGDHKKISINLIPTTKLLDFSFPFSFETHDDKILQNDEIRERFGQNFSYIGSDKNKKKWITKTENSSTSIGFLRGEHFIKVQDFPFAFEKIELLPLQNIFVFYKNSTDVLVATIDMQNVEEFSLPEPIISAFFQNNLWHIVTSKETLFFKNNAWKNNIRFSHFIDLEGKWRAGYIDSENISALKIGNYEIEKGSVLVLLNRETGEIFEIARNKKIDYFSIFEGKIIAISGKNFYLIELPKIGL